MQRKVINHKLNISTCTHRSYVSIGIESFAVVYLKMRHDEARVLRLTNKK